MAFGQRVSVIFGGNSYRGLGIYVPARVMGQFVIFCLGYEFAVIMGNCYPGYQSQKIIKRENKEGKKGTSFLPSLFSSYHFPFI